MAKVTIKYFIIVIMRDIDFRDLLFFCPFEVLTFNKGEKIKWTIITNVIFNTYA